MKKAIFSVTDKTGLAFFAKNLLHLFPTLEIFASGGTAKVLEKEKIPHKPISEISQFPECFGGRVKTLHPAILGGILFQRGIDDEEAKKLRIDPIDLVVCNLYLFDPSKKKEKLAESMDIGGSTLIRASSKNFTSVAIAVDPGDYPLILKELESKGALSLDTRFQLAAKAMRLSAEYETRLASGFSEEAPAVISLEKERKLSYGENPDQEGWVYSFPGQKGVASAKIFGQKTLSYNNYEDASCAFFAMQKMLDFLHLSQSDSTAAVIIKHGSPCGLATGKTLRQAFQKAWDGDTKSAFGSVIALSQEVDAIFGEELKNRFIELILAPSFTPAFLEWAAKAKPSLRLLQVCFEDASPRFYRSISGGMLVQTPQKKLFSTLEHLLHPVASGKAGVVTKRTLPKEKLGLLQFAIAAVQSVKSNAIVLVREYEPSLYQLIGVGGGQPNRIDSLKRLALPKAIENLQKEYGADEIKEQLKTLILASDGFFPFADSIEAAAEAGVRIFVQPGGSIRDAEVIQEADRRGLCMIFTGQRYFNH